MPQIFSGVQIHTSDQLGPGKVKKEQEGSVIATGTLLSRRLRIARLHSHYHCVCTDKHSKYTANGEPAGGVRQWAGRSVGIQEAAEGGGLRGRDADGGRIT